MSIRKFNWPIWAGLLLSIVAFVSYFAVFVWFPITRDFPWANLLLFALAAAFLFVGVRRAFSAERPRPRRSKIAGTMLVTLSIAIFALFIFVTLINSRRLPPSQSAPQIGQKAPDFTLSDTNGKPVSLAQMLVSPINGKAPKGTLLVFYRGYW